MVEKTIFIVKPIYIPVEVPSGKTGKAVAATAEDATANFPLTGKKKIKVKKNQQKAIYMERPKPPNYVSSQSSAIEPPKQKKGKSKKKQSERLNNRSPSPFSSIRKSHFETLNQSSIDGVGVSQTQQNLIPYS